MISVVIAAYNEEMILPELLPRLEKVLGGMGEYEIIFVDDGSRDRTAELIAAEHEKNSRIKLLQFSRNFGQVFAIRAGLAHASGDIIVMMDGDLQDLPEEIPKLVEKLKEGNDVVYGKRENRQDNWKRKLFSRLFIGFLRRMVPENELPKGGEVMLAGVFRALRKDVVAVFNSLPEHTIYIQGLILWVGFKSAVVPVEHGQRFAGRSNWTFMKLIRYALDAVISFSPYPLRKVSMLGLGIALLSFLAGIGYLIQRIFYGTQAVGFTTIILVVLFLGGMQLAMFGIIGEYLGRIYIETKNRPLYVIKRKLL